MRHALLALLILAVACGDTTPPVADAAPLSDSVVAALPVLTPTPASPVCTAIGADGCPLRNAVANRLGQGRFALWEPGFTVYVFGAGDTMGTPVGLAGPQGQYNYAVSVTELGRDRYRLILVEDGWRALEINGAGDVARNDPVPDPGILTAIGYVGDQLVRQRMRGWNSMEGGRFTVTLLREITDTTGSTLLDVPLPWLTGGNVNGPPVPPLIASSPSWSLASDGDVVWSPGDRLTIERRSPSGDVRWRLEGPPGPKVTPEDFTAREAAVRMAATDMPYTDEHFAEMRSTSDTVHPAVSGVTVTPSGDVFVARTHFTNREVVEYLRLDPAGTPNGRFTLDKRVRVLMAERDSLLVHAPTEGEPWEVRWMRLQ
jgi:hypothetical protein